MSDEGRQGGGRLGGLDPRQWIGGVARDRGVLLAAVVLYVLFRALVLGGDFDGSALPTYELARIGNLAAAGESGAPVSMYYDNCGGHLVTGLLAKVSYALLGDSYLALKLVPVVLGLATLVLLWSLLRRHVGRSAADLCALAFALGPPTLVQYSVLAKGNHFESLFFQVLCLERFLAAYERPTAGRWLTAGAAAGFAVFFYLGSLLLVALLPVVLVAGRGPRALGRAALRAAPGFAAGVLPLLWIEASTGGRVSRFLGEKVLFHGEGAGAERTLARAGDLLVDLLPSATLFRDVGPLPGSLADVLFLAVFGAAWVLVVATLVGRGPARLERPAARALAGVLVLYLPAWLAAWSLGRYDFDWYAPPVEAGRYRYLVPHLLFATALVAVAASRVDRRFGAPLAGTLLATVPFALPLAGTGFGDLAAGWRYEGHDYRAYAQVVLRDARRGPGGEYTWDEPRVAALLARLPADRRAAAWFGVGNQRARALLATSPDLRGTALLTTVLGNAPPEHRADVARGLGSFLRSRAHRPGPGRDAALARLAEMAAGGHPMAFHVAEGLALEPLYPLRRRVVRDVERSLRLAASVPEPLAGGFGRGLGYAAGLLARRGFPSDVAAARRLLHRGGSGAVADGEMWFGFGRGMAGADDPLAQVGRVEEWAPAGRLRAALRGLGAGVRARLGPEEARRVVAAARGDFAERQLAALAVGVRRADAPLGASPR